MAPHPRKRLSAAAVRSLGPGRHADGGGLYLEVDASGARRWFLRTVVHGRRRDVGLGSVTLVGLAEARDVADRLRRVARDGGDPKAERDKDRKQSLTFADAARTVHANQVLPTARNAKAAAQWLKTLEDYAFPEIGRMPVEAVTSADVLRVLSPIWLTKPPTAKLVKQRMGVVFDWTLAARHRTTANPITGITKGLPKVRRTVEHHAALPWQDLPAVMGRLADIDTIAARALRFAVLTAARSGEVRGMTWGEVDLEARTWTVPASRMKAGAMHRVPLTDAALAILEEVRPLGGSPDDLVFPARRGHVMNDKRLAEVLERVGVAATVHGMRSTFRNWAEECTSFSHETKESALAHAVADRTERAYRRTDLFDRRRELMDAWSRFATGGTGEVVPLRAAT